MGMTWRVVIRILVSSIQHARKDAFLIHLLLPFAFSYLCQHRLRNDVKLSDIFIDR